MGVTNVVKTPSQSAGPVITGGSVVVRKFWIALLLVGAMTATYDLGILNMFMEFQERHDEDVNTEGRRGRRESN